MNTLRAVAILAAVGCGYSPNPESGTLKCGPGASCPEGYTCGLSSTCWRPADKPEPLLGCWVFDAGSNQRIDWNDGTFDTLDLSTIFDFLEIEAGTDWPLLGYYYCLPMNLFLHGQSTVLEPDQECQIMAADGTQFSYFPSRFSFSTADGRKAKLEFSMSFDYMMGADSGSGVMRTTGTLTKGTAVTCPPPIAAPPPSGI